ncbi:MAG: hypothetical protein Fur003_0020 [Candidatus Dojkabacteria bacterium]
METSNPMPESEKPAVTAANVVSNPITSKPFLGVLMGIMTVLVIGGITFALYNYVWKPLNSSQEKSQTNQEEEKNVAENNENTSNNENENESESENSNNGNNGTGNNSGAIDTSTWKEYVGPEAGMRLSIKYPNDWYVKAGYLSDEPGVKGSYGDNFRLIIANEDPDKGMSENYYAFELVQTAGSGFVCEEGMEYGGGMDSANTIDEFKTISEKYIRGKYTTMADSGYLICGYESDTKKFTSPIMPGSYYISYVFAYGEDAKIIETLDQILLSLKRLD